MKSILFSMLLALAWPASLQAVINADGIGFFPIVVIVTDQEGRPVSSATVKMEDSGQLPPEEIDDPIKRARMKSVGQPVETDDRGVAVLFYYGRWSSSTTDRGEYSYSRQIRGKIVVDVPGFERSVQAVSDLVKGGAITSQSSGWAPTIYVLLKRKAP